MLTDEMNKPSTSEPDDTDPFASDDDEEELNNKLCIEEGEDEPAEEDGSEDHP